MLLTFRYSYVDLLLVFLQSTCLCFMICGAFGPYHTFCCLPFWFDFLLSCSFYMMYAFHNAFIIMLSVADLPMLLFSPSFFSFSQLHCCCFIMCAVKCKQQELFLHSLQCMQTVLEVMVPPTVLALQVSQPELSTSCVSFCCYCFITGIFLWCILMLLLLFHAFMLIDNDSFNHSFTRKEAEVCLHNLPTLHMQNHTGIN